MAYHTLITAQQLQALRSSGAALVVFDVSFDLADTAKGEAQYRETHLEGARYAHLDRDLSAKGQPDAASGGRHPLPAPQKLLHWAATQGVTPQTQVVVYDRQACTYCVRLWWMLRAAGHPAVAVLDGGLGAWQEAGGAVQAGPSPAAITGGHHEQNEPLAPVYTAQVATDFVASQMGRSTALIIDARAAARYRGEVEPLDRIAGHIPGALNRPFAENFTAEGYFKSAQQLRQEFDALLAGRSPTQVIHHCGSGVTATPNVLAMEIAGLHGSQLYAGSWSEWSSDPHRPVAQG